MKVIGVVGLPASGKGEISRIAEGMGIPVVVMGDVIRMRATEAGLEPTDLNLGEMSRRLRSEQGMDAIARLAIPVVESLDAPVVLVDGIRGDREVETFREHFPDFILIGVTASFETRLQRLGERGRPDDMLSAGELRRRDERELGWGLWRALEQADYILQNEGSLEEFTAAVRDLLRRVGGAR